MLACERIIMTSYTNFLDKFEFRHRHKMLVERLVSQRYRYERLRNSLKRLYGRFEDLIVKYQKSVLDIVINSYPSNTLLN